MDCDEVMKLHVFVGQLHRHRYGRTNSKDTPLHPLRKTNISHWSQVIGNTPMKEFTFRHPRPTRARRNWYRLLIKPHSVAMID